MADQNNRGNLGAPSSASFVPHQNQADEETSYLIAFHIFNQFTFDKHVRVDGNNSIFRDNIGLYHAEPSTRPPRRARNLRLIRLSPSSTTFDSLRAKIEGMFIFKDRNVLFPYWYIRDLTFTAVAAMWMPLGQDTSDFVPGDDDTVRELLGMMAKRGFQDTLYVVFDCT